MSPVRLPSLYISHGGGPCFWVEFPPPIGRHGFDHLRTFLEGLLDTLPAKPTALLVISAHWEEAAPTVTTSASPGMLYDYSGFPAHTYELKHPAPGSPDLARRVQNLLGFADILTRTDPQRGFDHGVFVPLKIIDPQAQIPTVVLSLQRDLDPAFHLRVGQALAPLRDEGVLIIGSGSSFHDLGAYFNGEPGDATAFDAWLTETATTPATRNQRLIAWETAPAARECHPREEHLLPMMVAAGAATGEPGRQIYKDVIANKPFSGYAFG